MHRQRIYQFYSFNYRYIVNTAYEVFFSSLFFSLKWWDSFHFKWFLICVLVWFNRSDWMTQCVAFSLVPKPTECSIRCTFLFWSAQNIIKSTGRLHVRWNKMFSAFIVHLTNENEFPNMPREREIYYFVIAFFFSFVTKVKFKMKIHFHAFQRHRWSKHLLDEPYHWAKSFSK